MYASIPLYELSTGGSAVVLSLSSEHNISKRFRELGIIEGTEIKKVFTSPFGDPSAYSVRGAVIAIRKADAKAVAVGPIHGEELSAERAARCNETE
jgi:ferrous iron transport protein A